MLFDPTTQKATLEPLDSTYTFNLSTKNKTDVSSNYTKIYPRKQKDKPSQDVQAADDLFDEGGSGDHENDEPDARNPYDFRHFLEASKEKRGDESEYHIPSSPDYRTGTGSAMNTPLMAARKPAGAVASKPKAAQPVTKARKRKSPKPEPLVSKKTGTKKQQATPTVRLERKASTRPPPDSKPPKKPSKATAPASSKIKSAEIVHSSDESDIDAEGEIASSPPHRHHSPEPEPANRYPDDDEDEEDGSIGGSGLEIEVPDARPKPRNNALASLGLGQNIGLGSLSNLRSPSNGPISLASAANSVEGSPNPQFAPASRKSRAAKDADVIDFGNTAGNDSDDEGGYEEDAEGEDDEMDDRDVEPMDIGPPAQSTTSASARKMSVSGAPPPEEDEDVRLYQEMMEVLGGGDSSEESEEE